MRIPGWLKGLKDRVMLGPKLGRMTCAEVSKRNIGQNTGYIAWLRWVDDKRCWW